MYRQEELKEHDEAIYQFYKTQKGIKVAITQAVHDHSIRLVSRSLNFLVTGVVTLFPCTAMP